MAVFKCKMCGGSLEITEVMTVVECEYCTTKQTLPRLDDDKKANLYDRAGHFRRNNEFDKAISVYEKILDEDNTDAEAYWSLVLCKYGIEYVEDPATHKRVPTVNRAQFTSVFADEDYKSAIQYADGVQKAIYEEEARAIDEIQKGILAISEKEEPFDVFICYKETDNNGRRTPDSVLANDLYHQLTQDGYKVFFARITLEDKLGTAYEPYIFAALNSAKVMVVLGTKPEYFNAAWVKNEWSRYLALIKNGGKKILIPAYKDMDPYDLPEEFSHLQAQDMSKLGFMQDLIRGIKKITAKDEPKQVVQERVVVNNTGSANTAALLERAFIFLEDGKWEEADEYCEKVLDLEPKNAEAYLGKLMAELEVETREELRDCDEPFDDYEDYEKIMRFGDETIKREMKGYIEHINNRIEQERLENAYNTAHEAMDKASDEYSYKSAASAFEVVLQYKDATELAEKCRKLAEDARINSIYNEASGLMNSNAEKDVIKAIDLFKSIIDWKDSEQKIKECHSRIEEIRAKAEADRIERERIAVEEARIAEEQRIERERVAEIERKEKAKKAKRNKIIALIVGGAAILSVASVVVFNTIISPLMKYNEAIALVDSGRYNDAIVIFEELGNYRNSQDMILSAKYSCAVELMNNKDYNGAKVLFDDLGEYQDSVDQAKEAVYLYATSMMAEKKYLEASTCFDTIWNYKDSYDRASEARYCIQKNALFQAKKGVTVKFGFFEQDNDTSNGKEEIEWEVLATNGSKLLLISKYALDTQEFYPYSSSMCKWDNSTIRYWLSQTFYVTAFGKYHQALIVNTNVVDHKNPKSNVKTGTSTTDKVFLLSIDEVEKYLQNDSISTCRATYYAKDRGAKTEWGNCYWWLRTHGCSVETFAYVGADGKIGYGGAAAENKLCIRPAMWIDISQEVQNEE